MKHFFLAALSFVIVAFGQPAWSPELGILASSIGYALFFSILLEIPSTKRRFLLSFFWFFCIQLFQLSWLISHPYSYIYGVYFFLASAIAAQFGLLGMLITPERIKKGINLLGLAGLFTFFEWSRLFFLSGYSFNPVGLALSSTLLGMQLASMIGMFGLSFVVILTNLLVLRFWTSRNLFNAATCMIVLLLPYGYGYFHIARHRPGIEQALKAPTTTLNALLVQTAFPTEETLPFASLKDYVAYVQNEWIEILKVLKLHESQPIDLIALPEYVVPFGTYIAVFPIDEIKASMIKIFGDKIQGAFPPLNEPLALEVHNRWLVTNAYICQTLANFFHADLVVGLQDDQWITEKDSVSYSAAFYFWPGGEMGLRYEKRVLLPMAEYIPFQFCQDLAKRYGISGSFLAGDGAKVFPGSKAPFGLSICYEETFGDLMRENRVKGAEVLINLTSDVWYPNSRLPKQHFDLARLRTVESGIPLIRACNTGITSALDSLGEIVGSIPEEEEWVRQGLFVKVPLYHYSTLYSKWGDAPVIIFSLISALFLFRRCDEN